MITPMKLTLSADVPAGRDWQYEVKYDGFRTLLHWTTEGITLTSRNGKDLSALFPEITALAHDITPPELPVLLDGELVILNTPYQANFPLLQQRGRLRNKDKIRAGAHQRPATFIAFDLLNDLTLSYEERRAALEKWKGIYPIRIIETFTDFDTIQDLVLTHQGEGIVAKSRKSRYLPAKRSRHWLKIKNWRTISGFLTDFNPENDYFHLAVLKSGSPLPIGSFKHGVRTEEAETLRTFFKENGIKKAGKWSLEPSICVDVHCLHAEKGEMREPMFHQFRFETTPDECTFEKMEWDLSLFPDQVSYTNLDKPLWPDVTKREYLLYLRSMAPYMLPFLKDKKLTLIRFPDGIKEQSFYQKHLPDHAPSFIETFVEKGKTYMIGSTLPSLLWAGNQGALEFHLPFQKAGGQDPDEIVFDLDPPSRSHFPHAIQAAQLIKLLLDELKVISFVKTSGNKGMQIHIPITEGQMSYEESRSFTEALSTLLVEQQPTLFTTERLKKNRGNRLYIDYVQHAEGKTIVAPYSGRATPKATVATPLFWEEVKEGLQPDTFTLPKVKERVTAYGCPFQSFNEARKNQPIETLKKFGMK